MAESVHFSPAFPVVSKYGRLGNQLTAIYDAGNAVAKSLGELREYFLEAPRYAEARVSANWLFELTEAKLREMVHADAKNVYALIALDKEEPHGIRLKAKEEFNIEEAMESDGHAAFAKMEPYAPHRSCVEALVYHITAAFEAKKRELKCEGVAERAREVRSDPNVDIGIRFTHACREVTGKVHGSVTDMECAHHMEALGSVINEGLCLVMSTQREEEHSKARHESFEIARDHKLPWAERLAAAGRFVSEAMHAIASHSEGDLRKAQMNAQC
jgi:hypothetical protein